MQHRDTRLLLSFSFFPFFVFDLSLSCVLLTVPMHLGRFVWYPVFVTRFYGNFFLLFLFTLHKTSPSQSTLNILAQGRKFQFC